MKKLKAEKVVPDYREAGAGPAVFMMPGMEGAHQFWRPQLEALSGRYRVIACELARFPCSPRRTVDDYARAALRRLDSLGVEKAVLVGESFGGMVAQHLALNYPERLSALILCNTMDKPRLPAFGLNVFTLATLAHNLAFTPGLSMARRRKLLMWVGKHRGFVMDPSPGNRDLIEYVIEFGTSQGATAYLDRIFAGRTADYSSRLGEMRVPTLVLRGSEDRMVMADTILRIAAGIPGARLALVEGGGHCCTHTMPEESNRLILAWLDGLGLGSGTAPDQQSSA